MSTALPTPCDGAAPEKKSAQPLHPNWTIATTMLASSLAFIDGSVTNVALSTIGTDVHGSAADLSWIINAYMLPLSALLLFGGAAGDHFGRRRVLIGGIALFAVASVGCALAGGLEMLLAFRAMQGLGAALLMPNSLGILGSSFEGEARGRAVGTWAAAGAISSAIGPPLGGWLVDAIGWRSIFYLNIPVAAAAIAAAWAYVEESDASEGGLDWVGAVLATAALGALTWALTLWSAHHAASLRVWIGVAMGAALLAAFVWAEHRKGERAMMPLGLFGSKAFAGLSVLTFLLYGALGGLILLMPYLLIVGGGWKPMQAGFALLPFSIVLGLASRITGRLTGRIGSRWPLTIGPIITGAGFALMVRADPHASYWTSLFPAVLVIALGMAGAVAPLTTAVLSSVDGRHTGTASGFNSAVARTGGLIATALSGAVIATSGAGLISAFHWSALVGAALAVASGVTAFATLDRD